MPDRNMVGIFLLFFFSLISYSADRLYTADEVSNTVSVVDPIKEELVGVVKLGRSRPYSFGAFEPNHTQINVHGLDISPDKKTLAAISNVTNSVTFIDVQSTQILGIVYVGRSPHTANYTPDGKEIWVNVRGEDYISVIDAKKMKIVSKIATSKAPSFTLFLKKKNLAFVSNAWTKKIEVFNYKTKKLIKNIEIENSFSPVMALSPDQKEIWLVQKDIDHVLRVDTDKLSIIDSFETGRYTQHTQFLKLNNQTFGLVTIGGDNLINIYNYDEKGVKLFKSIEVNGVPHGVSASPSGDKIFVALEHGDKVIIIDTENYKIKKSIGIGNSPQTILYVSDAVDETKKHEKNLSELTAKVESKTLFVKDAKKVTTGSVVLRSFEFVDYFTFQLFNINHELKLKVYLTESQKKFSQLSETDKTLIGYLRCFKGFTCISESNVPMNASLRSAFKESSKIYFINEDTKEIFLEN